MRKLFELENEDGEKIYFDNIKEVGVYIADDSKGFGYQSQFVLRGRIDTADSFELMAQRKYLEHFTRVYPNFCYLVNATNPSADTWRKINYIFTDLGC